MNEYIEVKVANRLEGLEWLYLFSDTVLNRLPYNEAGRRRLLVAVSEAFSNAYAHGNQADPTAHIKLTFYVSENSLKITVEDEARLPIDENVNNTCKHLAEGPHAEMVSGRGFFLMRQMVDSVICEYDPRGINRVTILSRFPVECRQQTCTDS